MGYFGPKFPSRFILPQIYPVSFKLQNSGPISGKVPL